MINSRAASLGALALALFTLAGHAESWSDQFDAVQPRAKGEISAQAVHAVPQGTARGRDIYLASRSFAAARTAKQQCMNSCRARYNDCRHLKQLPSSECRGVYQDCTKYSCTGLGPG